MIGKIIFGLCVLCQWYGTTTGFLSNDIFQTGRLDLFNLFCVKTAGELAKIGASTHTHESIITQGVKLAVLDYFNEKNTTQGWRRNLGPVLEDASLSEIYQHYFGQCSSPERFLRAVQGIVDGATEMDSLPGVKDDPRYNFDGEYLEESQTLLSDRFVQLMTTIMAEEKFPTARKLLGQNLHTLQRFYAHTNWVELGNEVPNPELGMPGGHLTNVSSPEEPTCDSSGLITSNLTSGYNINNQIDGETLLTPEGKCFHSHRNDSMNSTGINKDTSSDCFSPNAHHHDKAASLAIKATHDYVNYIRSVIGEHFFVQLFDFTFGSALAIVIDTSGSMGNEQAAVKRKVAEIVEEAAKTGVLPAQFVLVPTDDPTTPVNEPGPLTKTTDPSIFLEAVEKLDTSGSGTELVWSSVMLALTNTIPHSNIIVFTDEPGDDQEKKDSVIALAQNQHTQVSVVFSEAGTDPNYYELASSTGGMYIELDKTDADQIVDLLGSSVESMKALLSQYKNDNSTGVFDFLVDNTLVTKNNTVEIKISGSFREVFVISPSGVTLNMSDTNSINNSNLSVNIIINTNTLLDFTLVPDSAGAWQVKFVGEGEYSISAFGSCTFSFISDFRYLDTMASHPNLRKVEGRPVVGSSPILSIEMSGVHKMELEASLKLLGVSLISPSGEKLSYHKKKDHSYEDNFIIPTEKLQETSFYIRLEGKDSLGQAFWRINPMLISPASTGIEVTTSDPQLECTPGNSTFATFSIKNYGPASEISISAIDDKNFFFNISKTLVQLEQNSTDDIIVNLLVPSDATPGAVSTLTVTTTSKLDLTTNSAVVTLIVASAESDLTPPSCEIIASHEDNCLGVEPRFCKEDKWNFTATISDYQSGLGSVRVEPADSGNLTLSSKVPGTEDEITADYSAFCCDSHARLVALDLSGNINMSCSVNFELRNCSTFHIVDAGPTWISVSWSKPCNMSTVNYYEFTVTNLFTGEIDLSHTAHCSDFMCKDNITYTSSCIHYQLELNAHSYDAPELPVTYRMRYATTGQSITSKPENLIVESVSKTGVFLSWTSPLLSPFCVDHYLVCFSELHTLRSHPVCLNTTNTSIALNHLQPCLKYHFSVSAINSLGQSSQLSFLEKSTDFDYPGAPLNMRILETSGSQISVHWEAPDINPTCVKGYAAFCTETDTTKFIQQLDRAPDLWATIHGLHECTNYTCEVEAIGWDHSFSNSSSTTALTDIIQPSKPEELIITKVEQRYATLSWSSPEFGARCVRGYSLTWVEESMNQTNSEIIEDGEEVTINNLSPCSDYKLFIQALTEDIYGIMSSLTLRTLDAAPGKVRQLLIADVFKDGFLAKWKPPSLDFQCAQQYTTTLKGPQKKSFSVEKLYNKDGWLVEEVTGLECGSFYEFEVSGTTHSGLQGPITSVNVVTQDC